MYRIYQAADGTYTVTQEDEIVANFDTLKQATDYINIRVGFLMYRGF
jgi:hypothetical protein